MRLMSMNEAMRIVSDFGRDYGSVSLFDAVGDMEDNRDNLLPHQIMAMDIVIGEYELVPRCEFDI